MVMPPDPTPCPEQVQQHDATEQQGVKRHQSSSAASIARSIASLFSAEADELDATELKQYNHCTGKTLQDDHGSDGNDGGLQRGQATPSSCSHGAYGNNTGLTTPEHRDSSSGTRAPSSSASSTHTLRDAPSRFSIFWRNNISAVVPFKDARDHLALERTYLSYHRTSMVFAMLSVVTAQLTVINHSPTPSPSFGFHILGKPLSIVLACCAVACSIVGGLRWWRLQNGLLRGVAISGGKEVMIVGCIVAVILATTFGLVLAVDIHKEY